MSNFKKFKAARDLLQKNIGNYPAAKEEFVGPNFEADFNWAHDWFDEIASNNAKTALWIAKNDLTNIKISYQDMKYRSCQVAEFLQNIGIKKGDRILVCLSNVPAIWEVMLACIRLGAVFIPTTTLATKEDIIDRLERGAVKLILTSPELTHNFEGTITQQICVVTGQDAGKWKGYDQAYKLSGNYKRVQTKAQDPLFLYFTSGTTSKPKLVLHTHQSYPVGHLSTMYWIGLKEEDIHQNISSPGWAKHAWSNFFAPWNAGATAFVHDYERFDAATTLSLLRKNSINTLCAPPTVWRLLIQEDLGERPAALRELVSAGEPLNPEVIEAIERAWGITIRDGFGQTETTLQVGNFPGEKVIAGSMGKAAPGYSVCLINSAHEEVNEGEIALRLDERPLGLMVGYQDDPEKTAEVMKDGYYRTGDEAIMDEQGYIHYVGRGDDVFKCSDYRISPFELESVLIEHPAVAETAIVPSPDPVRTNVPKAYVVLSSKFQPTKEVAREILEYAKKELAPYKRIRKLEFCELPKTISGKIRRVELRKREASQVSKNERAPNEYWLSDF